jgi:predicted lipid-binding transport protein (Tim44 family)
MKFMTLVALAFFSTVLLSEPSADARPGGGRSFGSRGTRSVAPRSYGRSMPPSSQAIPQSNRPYTPQPQSMQPNPYMGGGGGFMRNMLGGIAGGFIGTMLFRSLGFGGNGMIGTGGGLGILEVLLLGALAFFLFRTFTQSRRSPVATSGAPLGGGFSGPELTPEAPHLAETSTLAEDLRAVGASDPSFNEEKFKEMCVDGFFRIQAAWMQRDLAPVGDLMTTDVLSILEQDLSRLKELGQVNRLENIAVRETSIEETWHEQGANFITLRFFANLLDFTVNEKDGALVSGSKSEPVKFEEFWTYRQERGRGMGSPWRLCAVEQKSAS